MGLNIALLFRTFHQFCAPFQFSVPYHDIPIKVFKVLLFKYKNSTIV